MIFRISTCALCLVCLAPAAARAQQDEPARVASAPDAAVKQEAARRFEAGIALYEDGDYALALAEFERVYELVPDYRVLYNIGQVSMQLGRYARALRTLREYMSRGADAIPNDRRSAVRTDLDVLETRTAVVSLDIHPAGADVWIDGVLVGHAPLAEPVVLDVGERAVQVRLAGYVSRTQTLTLAGRDRRELSISLDRETPVAVAAPSPVSAPPPLLSLRPEPLRAPAPRPWLWVGWGTTGALAVGSVVGVVLGASSASNLKELRDSSSATREELDAERHRAKTRFLVADVLGVAAVAAGATTLYFQLSDSSRRERERGNHARVGLSVLPNGVSLRVEH